jgi:Zn-dependent protease with chaperone function
MATDPAPEDGARARAYHRRQLVLSLGGLALSVAYLLALIETRAAARVADLVARSAWWLELAAVFLVLAGGHRLLTLPLAWLGGFWLPRRYGLLRLTSWWWLWGAAAFLTGYTLLALVAPIWLVPLFYRLTPLRDGPLRTRLLALADRVGVPVTGVFVVDQSRKSRTANAAVTGLGRTRRILLFDTLLQQFAPEEIEAVLAHELAHQLHGDIRRGLLVQGALTLVTFWVADAALRWGVGPVTLEGPAAVTGLPILGLVLLIVSLAALPLANGWSRHVEWQADRFALQTIPDPGAFIASLERLAVLNLADREPPRLEELLLYSHPSIARRIAHARQFRHALT